MNKNTLLANEWANVNKALPVSVNITKGIRIWINKLKFKKKGAKLISSPTYFKRSEGDYVNKNSHLAIDSKEFEFTKHLKINYFQIPCQHFPNKILQSS